jgi:hypothetical protein
MTQTPPPKSQVDKFRDLARELECDDDQAAFDEKLKKLAPKPKGEWSAPVQAKVGAGFISIFRPNGYGPEHESPTFETPEQVTAWTRDRADG